MLSLFILFKHKYRRYIFYQLLIVMAFFDTLFIASFSVYMGNYSMACTAKYIEKVYLQLLAFPFLNVGLYGSIYTTIMISIERYIGICHPFHHNNRKIWMYIVPILLIQFSYNLPLFFEYEFTVTNGTIISTRRPWADKSEVYFNFWIRLTIEDFLPIFMIVSLNIPICRRINVKLTTLEDGVIEVQRHRNEATKTLKWIVGIFLFTRIMDIVDGMLFQAGSGEEEFRQKWFFLVPIKDLMILGNSSINFVIYFLVGTKFRSEFRNLLNC